MARAKASSSRPKSKPAVEELYFRSDSAYLCVILNRRTGVIRVIDFRSGALPAKRLYIQSIAKQEGVTKVLTLVEKDEVSSWTRVGFVREGTIPGFYKRSDGHLCGCVISDKTASVTVSDDNNRVAEKTINEAKKNAKEIPDAIRGASISEADEKTALAARDAAWKKEPALGAFDAFGRDADRLYLETSMKRGKKNYVHAEFQDCFGHSLVEVLNAPETESDVLAVTAALRHLGETLKDRGIVSAFSFAPIDHVGISTAFTAAGYRKTGLLAEMLATPNGRTDAILWTNKLYNPGEEESE
ncbi:MAG: hypothetical protein R3A47_08835 [Polyangiales bacterium]